MAGVVIALPLAIVAAIGYGVYKHVTRPMPTEQLQPETEQRSTIANFPNRPTFLGAHLERLLDSLAGEYPANDIYHSCQSALN
jgi:hypothetical protein